MKPGNIVWKINISSSVKNEKNLSEEDLMDIVKFVNESKTNTFGKTTGGVNFTYTPDEVKFNIDFEISIRSPYVVNDCMEGIKNLMKWFEVVLDDRDWDYRYITEVLRFKIENTCKYIEETQRHLNWQKDVKYMKLALSLINKIWGDEFCTETLYESEYSDYHVSQYNWIPCDKEEIEEMEKEEIDIDLKGSTRMEVIEISNTFDEFFAKNKLSHKKAIEYLKTATGWSDPESKMVQAMVISKFKHKKAIKLLFKILSEHIESWWD